MLNGRSIWVTALTLVVACSSDEQTGSSAEKVTTSEGAGIISTAGGHCGGSGSGIESQETSSVWQAGGFDTHGRPIPASWLVGVNQLCNDPGPNIAGLARAIDTTPFSWSAYCNMAANCNGGLAVPFATDVPRGGFVTQNQWEGDPYLASTRMQFPGAADIVAYVNLAGSNVGAANMIVAAISFDGGVTWPQNIYVNEDPAHNASQPVCTGGISVGGAAGGQDQPAAAWDTTVFPPRLWVTWRNNVVGSTGEYGACTQFFDVNPNTQVVTLPAQAPQVVPVQHAFLYGVGGLIVRAQNRRVTLVYSNTDHHYNCPSGPIGVTWLSISSDNNGVTWTPSTVIETSVTFAPCLANNNVSNQMRTFGFINDNVGDYYAALPTAKDTIHVYRSTTQGNTWSAAPIKSISGGVGSRIFPFLNSDGPGSIGLHYYITDASDVFVTPVFEGTLNAPGGVWDPETAVGPQFHIDTAGGPCLPNTQQCRTLGDYTGIGAKPRIVGVPAFTYLPAWTQFPLPFNNPPFNVVGNERSMASRVKIN